MKRNSDDSRAMCGVKLINQRNTDKLMDILGIEESWIGCRWLET